MKKSNKFKIAFTLFIVLFCLVVGGYMVVGRWNKNQGKEVFPTEAVQPIAHIESLQKDIPKGSKLPPFVNGAKSNPAALPLLISTALSHIGITSNYDEVHHHLDSAQAYLENGELNWKKIEKLYPGASHFHKKIFDGELITEELKQNKLVIAEVLIPQTSMRHWVMIYGATASNFLIYDPLKDYTPSFFNSTNLSRYGKVYAVRVIYKTSYRKLGK